MQTGFFVLADITGYTAYMAKSELEHAQGIMKELFGALLDNLESPLRLSNIQGDAILAYAADPVVVSGQTLLEAIEHIYFAFAKTLEHMVRNTTCPCQACANISELDLKLIVHHGEFASQSLAGREEISGSAVIHVHRLAKNSVSAATGIKAYCLLTDEAVAELGLTDYFADAPRHRESYEHIGEIECVVYDMDTVWQARRDEYRATIDSDEKLWCDVIEVDLPVGPAAAWPYIADGEQRLRWVNGATAVTLLNTQAGRVSNGTEVHCAHGDQVFPFTVIDWQPHQCLMYRMPMPRGCSIKWSHVLTPTPDGCRLTMKLTAPVGDSALNTTLVRLMTRKMAKFVYQNTVVSSENLRALIEADLAAGRIADDGDVEIAPATIDAALDSRFATQGSADSA